jgi:lysyl endopeptidase
MRYRCFVESLPGRLVSPAHLPLLAVLVLVLAVPGFAQTRQREKPRSFSLNDKSQEQVQRKVLPKVDVERLLAEDRARGKNTQRPGPRRFAVAVDVNYTLENSGTWQTLDDGRLWRLRIQSPGAKSHNLGITRFEMPEGAKLWIYDPARKHVEGPYTSRNRSHAGSLWTPVIEGEEIVVEVFVPTGVSQPVIGIRKVNQGYTGFNKDIPGGGTEGDCEIDVVCPRRT